MAKRTFAVETPEQLKVLHDGLSNKATVWSADRRSNGGKSNWNGQIFVSFESSRAKSADANYRRAYTWRRTKNGNPGNIEMLMHYNTMLRWCKENLKPCKEDGSFLELAE